MLRFFPPNLSVARWRKWNEERWRHKCVALAGCEPVIAVVVIVVVVWFAGSLVRLWWRNVVWEIFLRVALWAHWAVGLSRCVESWLACPHGVWVWKRLWAKASKLKGSGRKLLGPRSTAVHCQQPYRFFTPSASATCTVGGGDWGIFRGKGQGSRLPGVDSKSKSKSKLDLATRFLVVNPPLSGRCHDFPFWPFWHGNSTSTSTHNVLSPFSFSLIYPSPVRRWKRVRSSSVLVHFLLSSPLPPIEPSENRRNPLRAWLNWTSDI